jgi:hypothetical protein
VLTARRGEQPRQIDASGHIGERFPCRRRQDHRSRQAVLRPLELARAVEVLTDGHLISPNVSPLKRVQLARA